MNRPSPSSPPQTVAEVETALDALRAKRGYLLPHHGLLAVSAPALLEAYDATYTAMTLTRRVMTDYEKEIVWLIILVSTGEAIATHHIDRLYKSGGCSADVEAALALAAWSEGAEHHAFVAAHWGPHLKDFDAVAAYRNGLETLLTREHITGAYTAGADEGALAEGQSLALFPGGVPNFVDACDEWRKMIAAGEVEASAPYLAWARMTGQGGFDEAAGLT